MLIMKFGIFPVVFLLVFLSFCSQCLPRTRNVDDVNNSRNVKSGNNRSRQEVINRMKPIDDVVIPKNLPTIDRVLGIGLNRAVIDSQVQRRGPKYIETVIGFDQAMVDYLEDKSSSFNYKKYLKATLTSWNFIMMKLGFHIFVTKQVNLTTTDLPLSHDRNNSAAGYLQHLAEANAKNVGPVYRQDFFLLFTGNITMEPTKTLGIAYIGGACLEPFYQTVSWVGLRHEIRGTVKKSYRLSETIAHEAGHYIGLPHEQNNNQTDPAFKSCRAPPGETCIMNAYHYPPARTWSDYSHKMVRRIESRGNYFCFYRQPDHPELTEFPICGNNIIEPGETCDCPFGDNSCYECCDMQSCLLINGAECSSGGCCQDCRIIRDTKHECYPSVNLECDEPDFCDGQTEKCVDRRNDHKESCGGVSHTRCFKGICEDKCYLNCSNNGTCEKRPAGTYPGFHDYTCNCDGDFFEWFCYYPVPGAAKSNRGSALLLVLALVVVLGIIILIVNYQKSQQEEANAWQEVDSCNSHI